VAQRDSFSQGVLAGALIMVGADSLHWFITPAAHPGASTGRTLAVALQAVLAFGIAIALFVHHHRTHSQPRNAV
jgi:hypothetical protein